MGLSTSVIILTPMEPERTYLEQRGLHGDSPAARPAVFEASVEPFAPQGMCRPIPVVWAQPTLREVAPTVS